MATINTSLIASTGGDYATPQLWEADTDNDLVTADVVEVGEAASETWAGNAAAQFTGWLGMIGATTDSTRYRELKAGTNYSPITDTGPVFDLTATANGQDGIYFGEQYFRLTGVCVKFDVAGYSNAIPIDLRLANYTVDGVTIIADDSSSGGTGNIISQSYRGGNLRNCLIIDNSGGSFTYAYDLSVSGGGTATAHNCVAYGASAYGMLGTQPRSNCVMIGQTTQCYSSSLNQSYNVSSDATAAGTGSVASTTAAACFEDAASNDFRPKDGGPLDSVGTDLSGTFTTDITGATRTLWSIGSYDAPAAAAVTATINKNFSTTEYIPAHFQFSAWDSTVASGGLKDAEFKWTISGGSEHDGIFTGPDLGLVFTTAGTFTVRLDVVDAAGNAGDASTTVTVATPTYDNTIYVSAAGSDSNDGLTDGAPKLTFAAAWTALQAAHSAGEHSRLLLRSGDTFNISATQGSPASGSGTFYWGSYGAGARPVLSTTSGILSIQNSSTKAFTWKLRGIDFASSGTTHVFQVSADDDDASTGARGIDFVMIDCDIDNSVGYGTAQNAISFFIQDNGDLTQIAYGDYTGLTHQNNVALHNVDIVSEDQFCVYGWARWLSIMDCNLILNTNTHVTRFSWASRVSARNNRLEALDGSLTMMRFTSQGDDSGARRSSHEITVVGNEFICGCGHALQGSYSSETTVSDLVPVGREFFANNTFRDHPTSPWSLGTWTAMSGYGQDVAMVGNRAYGNCIMANLESATTDVVTDSTYEVLVANNSHFTNTSNVPSVRLWAAFPLTLTLKNNAAGGSGTTRFIQGSSTAGEDDRITSDHNVCDTTAWAVNVGSAGTRTFAQWQTDESEDAASVAADPAFADPANDDWSIGVDSPCYDAGETIYASWLTREGTERSGTWDIGAFEIPAASPTSENMSGYLNLANIRVRAGQTLAMAFTGTGNAKGRYILTVELE